MTIKEINTLRKSGKLEEALKAAEEEFSLNRNHYTASALFWCLNDLCKQETNQDIIAFLYERMSSLYEEYCEGNEYMPKSLNAIDRHLNPISKALKEAIEIAKEGVITENFVQRCYDLFANGNLNENLYHDFGWLIFYNLKNTPLNDVIKRKQLLHYYLKLKLPRPELLHSLILTEAVKIEKNTPLQFRIRDFMNIWGWDSLRTEDWKQYKSDNGNTILSLVEKLISVYAKELKSDNIHSSENFNDLVDKALERYPNNQYMPFYKATVLMSLGKKEEALEYYKQLILKSSSKCYLWNQASALLEDIDLKIALLCKAISVERDESFIGGCRLNLAKAFIEKGLFSNAKYEIDKYRDFYTSQDWTLKQEFWDVVNLIPQETASADNQPLYNEYSSKAEDFIYSALPSISAIKIEDRQVDDKNHPGRKLTQWTLRSKEKILRLRKPSKFGFDNKMKNGVLFNIKVHDTKVVWIKQSLQNVNEQDWIKEVEGSIRIRTDRKGKSYAILNDAYIAERLLKGIVNGDKVKIIAFRKDDYRWTAISLVKI